MENKFEKPIYKLINSDILQLSSSNPRFLKPVKNEKEAILEMLRLKKVGPKKIKNLITDIIETDIILEDFIVLNREKDYIVFDGNRRLTAIKLFKEENLMEIKSEFADLYAFIIEMKKIKDISNMIVSAKIYSDEQSVINHVRKIHSGEQDGVGQIGWSSIEKANFDNQTKPTFRKLFLAKLSKEKNNQKLYDEIVNKNISTTIDRIFGFSSIKTRIFGLKRGEELSLENEKNFRKVCEMVEFFLSKNGSVSDVYLKDDATSFFSNITPVEQTVNFQLALNEVEDGNILNEVPDETKIDIKSEEDVKVPITGDTDTDNKNYQLFLDLKKKYHKIRQYQDFDLSSIIKNASDVNGESLNEDVEFYLSDILLKDNIFPGDSPAGKYNIHVKLEKNSLVKSHSLIIEVEEIIRKLTPIKKTNNDLFVPISSLVKGDVILDISETINNIILEINSLEEPEKFPLMIASSVRQLLERSIDLLIVEKSLKYKKADTDSMISLLNDIKTDKKLLGRLVNGENKMSYQEINNLISSIDTNSLVRYLHLITHNSSHTFYNDLRDVINKKITPFLILIHNYLKLDNRP